jgi:integrase/recombinase XerD
MQNQTVLKDMIEGFILSCRTEGLSPKTIESYEFCNTRFRRFLEDDGSQVDIVEVQRLHVRMFIRHLQTEAKVPRSGKPLSQGTVQHYVRALKSFFSWAYREEYIPENPMKLIPVPKATVKVLNTFDQEQIKQMLQACDQSCKDAYRNKAMILLLLDTGLRISELIGINVEDINLGDGYILIKNGKGNKERVVPIGSMVQKMLWRYIHQYRRQPLTERITALFIANHGLSLTGNGILLMLRRLAAFAGITGVRCSPHTLRHTFAKNYLINGGDIFSLQKILGHSSLASVRIYLNLFAVDIKKQHRRFSPVDTLAENRTVSIALR